MRAIVLARFGTPGMSDLPSGNFTSCHTTQSCSWRGLLASIPGGAPGRRLRAIEGTVPMLGALPPGCAFNPRCPDRFEPCTSAPPPEYAVGGDHGARCYLHDPVWLKTIRLKPDTTSDTPSAHGGRHEAGSR